MKYIHWKKVARAVLHVQYYSIYHSLKPHFNRSQIKRSKSDATESVYFSVKVPSNEWRFSNAPFGLLFWEPSTSCLNQDIVLDKKYNPTSCNGIVDISHSTQFR